MKVGIIGLGLIGGSLCKALKKYTYHTVFGSDINHDIEYAALRDVAIDKPFDNNFEDVDYESNKYLSNINPEMLCNIEDIINLFLLNNYNNIEQLENIKSVLDYLEIYSFDYLNMYSIINTLKDVANNNTTLPETNIVKTNKLF